MSVENTTPTKLAYCPQRAAKRIGIGLTKLYAEIKAGRLQALKCGRRTLITEAAILEWLANLPVK